MKRLVFALLLLATPSWAGSPVVERVSARSTGNNWVFEVTVRHADEGWDHFVDGWGVYAPDGSQLAFRQIHHPHEDEQPFTRSVSGVSIPANIDRVTIRAHDTKHGWSTSDYVLKLR